MGAWIIGYPDGLDAVANEAAGIALYDKWSLSAITIDAKTSAVTGGQVTARTETTLTDTGQFIGLTLTGGWIKMRNGTMKGEVYKIHPSTPNTDNIITCEVGTTLISDGVAVGDWYEVITGSASFTFPTQRNPTRKDIKRTLKGVTDRFPYYEGGMDIPLGYEADDFVVMAFLENETQFKTLGMLLSQKMDYSSYDGNFTSDEAAPLILQTGTADADHQFLVSTSDYKVVKDGNRGGYIEVMFHCRSIVMPSYRGI